MPKVFLIKDFSGGLNRRFRQSEIADNESPALRNARYTLQGALTKRAGTTRNVLTNITHGTVTGGPRSLFSYQLSQMSNEQILICVEQDNESYDIYRATTLGTYTSLFSGITTSNGFGPEFSTLNGKVYITAGNMTVRSVDKDNTTASVANAPKSRFIVSHKGYLFYLNLRADFLNSRLQWSDINDGDTYTSTNFEDVQPNDGGHGTGMVSFGDELIIFKGPLSISSPTWTGSSMWRVLGDTFNASSATYLIEQIPTRPNLTLIHHRTAKIYNGALVFWTNEGPYAYLGRGREPEPIGEILRNDFVDITDASAGSWGGNTSGSATVWRNRYICSLYNTNASSDGFSNRIYVYDGGKWWVDIISSTTDDFTSGGGTGIDWASFGRNLYSLSSNTSPTNGILRQWNASDFGDNTDTGTSSSVNFSYATKEFNLGKRVFFTHGFIHMKRQSSGTLTLEANVDQRGAVSNSVSMTSADTGDTANSSSNIIKKRFAIARHGRTIQFRFHDRSANDVEIYGVEVYYNDFGV